MPPRNLRERLRRLLLGTIGLIVALAILAYALDFAVFHIRVATSEKPYGSVVVNHYYAVLQKNGKTQFIFDPPQAENCVNSLFPHADLRPCWYLKRHPEQRIDI